MERLVGLCRLCSISSLSFLLGPNLPYCSFTRRVIDFGIFLECLLAFNFQFSPFFFGLSLFLKHLKLRKKGQTWGYSIRTMSIMP